MDGAEALECRGTGRLLARGSVYRRAAVLGVGVVAGGGCGGRVVVAHPKEREGAGGRVVRYILSSAVTLELPFSAPSCEGLGFYAPLRYVQPIKGLEDC
jgi:hypothetical protein